MANILVVDDEKSMRSTLREFLTDADYEVGVAEDAERAMGMLAAKDFDVVLADIILPQVTGVTLLKAIKETSPHVQVILMTGEPTVETASEAVRAGAFDYLSKPIGKERLLKTVANAAKTKALDDECRRLAEENEQHRENLERLVEERTAALRESQERTELALAGADLGTWDWNVRTGEVTVDERWAARLEYALDDLEPKLSGWKELVHPDDLADVEKALQAHLEGKTDFYETEHRVRIKSDESIWVLDKGRVIQRDACGNPLRACGTYLDISDRKRAEKERQEIEAQHRQAQKMEAVGQLAAGVSHDFNNVLQAILLGAETMIASLEADLGSSSPLLAGLRAIEEDAMRAAALTRQLLTFSRQDVAHPSALDLGRVLAEMEEMLRRLIPEDISLTMSLDPRLPGIYADRSRIEQVIMNLVVNSRDAMPSGGQLILETTRATLDETSVATHGEVRPGPHVLLSVSDTGIGMKPETRDRIFEPFFTTKGMGKGTGLGLATVYGIVQQAGGDVRVFSEPGQGTSFRIYLPAIEATAEEPDERPGTAPALGGTETVLFCEDDERVRREAVRALRDAGYTVLAAENGEHALRLAAEHREPVDLLVTDMIMPGMNGKELADALTAARPRLRTLFVSGYSADVIGHHGVLDEGVKFLAKPVRRRSLLRRARELLDEPLSR